MTGVLYSGRMLMVKMILCGLQRSRSIFQLAEAIFNSNSAAALAAVDEILEHGFSLIDHSRQK